jgi:transposase-like protein
MRCKIVAVGRRRDGGTRYWCLAHHANATAKYGVEAKKCVAANDPPIRADEQLDLDVGVYQGGVALWGSVPAVFDTTIQPVDRGIHVHARSTKRGVKDIDQTYRRLRIPIKTDLLSDGWLEVDEIDAINYMVSSVFGFATGSINCTVCGFPHLDRDWFAVHAHRKHQCHGCGRQFSDSAAGIGNPLANVRAMLGASDVKSIKAPRSITLHQNDYPGGIQIWGSNRAILWTSGEPEETGIHVHAFARLEDSRPFIDDTYARVTIDGVKIDPAQVRTYMAQSAMPHLENRVIHVQCPTCGDPHFDQGELAFTPHVDHVCLACNSVFQSPTRMKNTIGNPFILTRQQLAANAPNPLRQESLGLRPETI